MTAEMNQICIPNINAKERRRRLKSGVILFGVGLVVLIGLVATAVNPWWRLLLFPLFMGAASGYFQWRDKT
jgi:hypothetical protein